MAKNPGRNQNLVQNRRGDYTPEELHEWVVKAGRASADKRRRMKAQREILRDLMRTDCADEAVAEALISAGMEPSGPPQGPDRRHRGGPVCAGHHRREAHGDHGDPGL